MNHFRTICGAWHIDFDYGLEQLGAYLHNIELLEKGATVADLFSLPKEKSKELFAQTDSALVTINSVDEAPENSILEVSFSGVMRNDDGLCSVGVESFNKTLYAAYSNPNIKGILVNLNSGGGESSSGYSMQQAIADANKPLVVRTNLLGSAALNAAIAAKEIIAASEGAMIGSIGSYFSINMQMLSYIKNNYKDIYSKVSPDKNKSFRQALEGDFSLMEKEATQSAINFQKAVIKNRSLKESTKDSTLAGGMFYAQDAKNRGLVDAVGSRAFALKRINSLLKYS